MSDRINILTSFIAEDPDDPFNYYALALELKATAREECKSLLLKLVMDFPDYLPSYYQLALLHEESNEFHKAVEYTQKGIGLAFKQNDRKTLAELKQLLSQLEDE